MPPICAPAEKIRKSDAAEPSADFLILAGIFFLSRFLAYKAGVQFYSHSIDFFWQFIDPLLMKTRLLESIYYLQSQPPLFNLFLGCVVKIFPKDPAMTLCFHALYTAMGLSMTMIIFRTLRLVDIPRVYALTLTALFIISPSCLAYENFLMTAYPLVFFFCLSAYCLVRYLQSDRLRMGVGFFGCLAAVVLIHSAYHLIYFVTITAVLCLCLKPARRRRWLLCALGPFLIVGFVYVKNLCLFNIFTTGGTWSGAHLSMAITYRLPAEKRQELVDQKILSPFAFINPLFSRPDQFRQYLSAIPKTGIPVLDQEKKSTGAPNMNHLIYLAASKRCLADGLYVGRHYPGIFWQTWIRSLVYYTFPGPSKWSGEGLCVENMRRIRWFETTYNQWILGEAYLPFYTLSNGNISGHFNLPFVVGLPFILILVPIFIVKDFTKKKTLEAPSITAIFLWMSIGYTMLAHTAGNTGENNMRYRFNTEPLQLILTALLVRWILLRLFELDKKLAAASADDALRKPGGPSEAV